MAEQWDLTHCVSPYLDRHMMFPLLEFLDGLIANHQIGYSADQVKAARLALVRPTKMMDYALEIVAAGTTTVVDNAQNNNYNDNNNATAELTKELQEEKDKILQQMKVLEEGCHKLTSLCENEELVAKLKASGQWNTSFLEQNHGITADMVETFKKLARFKFDCGIYKEARNMLTLYLALFAKLPTAAAAANNENQGGGLGVVTEEDEFLPEAGAAGGTSASNNASGEAGNASMYYLTSVDHDMLQVLWGNLASEIMVLDWEAAPKAVEAVRTAIESMAANNSLTPLQALQQRTWLLHWSLFVYWNNSANGLEHLVELFHADRYKQAITTHAPHLLRYLTAAVLLCKRRKKTNDKDKNSTNANATMVEARRLLRNLVYVMQDCDYTDPIVAFVHSLLVKFDFDMAQTKLAECQEVLKTDFFLCHQTDLFMEEARVFLFENYCRIHHKIDLKALGFKFLAMDPAEAERWMVDLIRTSDVLQNSKCVVQEEKNDVDDQHGVVVLMEMEPVSIYEQVMDRTRDLNVRSATLSQSLQNRFMEARKEKSKREKTAREE